MNSTNALLDLNELMIDILDLISANSDDTIDDAADALFTDSLIGLN